MRKQPQCCQQTTAAFNWLKVFTLVIVTGLRTDNFRTINMWRHAKLQDGAKRHLDSYCTVEDSTVYVPDLEVIHISQDLIISPAFHIIKTALLLNVLLNELWSADDDVSNALRHIHFFKRQYHLVTVVDNYFFIYLFIFYYFFSPPQTQSAGFMS